MEVFTEEWCTACCGRLNARESYRTAAADWEGSVVLVMTADPAQGVDAERAVWIDAQHGICHDSHVASTVERSQATYVLQADPAGWQRLLDGQADPVSSLMTGKLKLVRGNLFALAKYAPAAKEMVLAAGEVGGTFPARRG